MIVVFLRYNDEKEKKMFEILDVILVIIFACVVPLAVTVGCAYIFALAIMTTIKNEVPTFDKIEMFSLGFLCLLNCIWFWRWVTEIGGGGPGYAHAGVVIALMLFMIVMGFPLILKRALTIPYFVMFIIYGCIMMFGL